ncbi:MULTISPECIES: hypothetical protein [Exiguobacterium]|uniref:hypothetical protein n=1 Tax=Exiguobacterium TaxID=33986 RepID=UPI001BEB8C3E|nr:MULTISPECIES: hypothetical protein [Exiguobacterium]MCT4783630.1 hypothetical protein [Exiguobacterium himgiriensis]
MWTRKVIAASFTAPVYAFLLASCIVIAQDSSSERIIDTLNGLLMLTAAYLVVSFPIIVTYGVLTSVFSDWVASRMSMRFELFVSFGLHIGFGLALLWLGVGAALLYWTTDRYLRHKGYRFKTSQSCASLILPVGVAVTAITIVYLISVIQDVLQRLYG